MLGQGYYSLKPLGYLIDNPSIINVFLQGGKHKVKLDVNILPCDVTGDPDGISDEMLTDNPEDLKGHRMDFIVEINHAMDFPKDLCKDIFVEYQFYLDEELHRTQICEGKQTNPVFNYRKQHTIEYISDGFLKYLDVQQVRGSPHSLALVQRIRRHQHSLK